MLSDRTPADWIRQLEALWGEGIPLAGAMAVEIRRLDGEFITLAAPLAPNRNHMGSAFGGSLQSLATLTGWAVTLITAGQVSGHVVIRTSQMKFLTPVAGELVAEAPFPAPVAAAAFRSTLAARGHARLTVPVAVLGRGCRVAGRFVGEFVAFVADR
jgi:thioesterase domain-containing protein